jgi:hypothetical protein
LYGTGTCREQLSTGPIPYGLGGEATHGILRRQDLTDVVGPTVLVVVLDGHLRTCVATGEPRCDFDATEGTPVDLPIEKDVDGVLRATLVLLGERRVIEEPERVLLLVGEASQKLHGQHLVAGLRLLVLGLLDVDVIRPCRENRLACDGLDV